MLQPLRWHSVESCAVHHERDVREEQTTPIYTWREQAVIKWSLLLLVGAVWSFAYMPLALSDRNNGFDLAQNTVLVCTKGFITLWFWMLNPGPGFITNRQCCSATGIYELYISNQNNLKTFGWGGDSSVSECRFSIGRLGVQLRPTTTEWIPVALLGQEHTPKPPRQEAHFRLRPAANCRHQHSKKI